MACVTLLFFLTGLPISYYAAPDLILLDAIIPA